MTKTLLTLSLITNIGLTYHVVKESHWKLKPEPLPAMEIVPDPVDPLEPQDTLNPENDERAYV